MKKHSLVECFAVGKHQAILIENYKVT